MRWVQGSDADQSKVMSSLRFHRRSSKLPTQESVTGIHVRRARRRGLLRELRPMDVLLLFMEVSLVRVIGIAGPGPFRWPANHPSSDYCFCGVGSTTLTTCAPTNRSHVPAGRYTHASGFASVVTWPWHALVLVAQSFLPALTIPAHCSIPGTAATEIELEASAPAATTLETASFSNRSFFIAISFTYVVTKSRD